LEGKTMFRDANLCLAFPHHHSRLPAFLAAARVRLRDWYTVYRQRRALLRLDDALLKDIGISRVDAFQEGSKPFWRS
jgi:uncharacterized protein YjiS (DUF1127 family)